MFRFSLTHIRSIKLQVALPILMLALGVTSCEGDIYTGAGSDWNKCYVSTATGQYSGEAVSNAGKSVGTMRLSVTQKGGDSCEIHGAATLPPCVPVTAITGRGGGVLRGFVVETVTSNPQLRVDTLFDFTFLQGSSKSTRERSPDYRIGEKIDADYTLTSQGIEGCPASHSGTVILTRTE